MININRILIKQFVVLKILALCTDEWKNSGSAREGTNLRPQGGVTNEKKK